MREMSEGKMPETPSGTLLLSLDSFLSLYFYIIGQRSTRIFAIVNGILQVSVEILESNVVWSGDTMHHFSFMCLYQAHTDLASQGV